MYFAHPKALKQQEEGTEGTKEENEEGPEKKRRDSGDKKALERDVSGAALEMLECPVCLDYPRSRPIYTCGNGHVVCSTCRQVELVTFRVNLQMSCNLQSP